MEKLVLEKYGVKLRLVEIDDAEFIVRLRTDSKLSAFISATSGDVEAQKAWIRSYKEREATDREYYFIVEKDGASWGTIRIYNLTNNSFESGSWVFLSDAPSGISILSGIVAREFAFGHYPWAEYVTFSVRKKNKHVLAYHKRYNPELVGETDLDYFFQLSRERFFEGAQKYLRLLGIDHG